MQEASMRLGPQHQPQLGEGLGEEEDEEGEEGEEGAVIAPLMMTEDGEVDYDEGNIEFDSVDIDFGSGDWNLGTGVVARGSDTLKGNALKEQATEEQEEEEDEKEALDQVFVDEIKIDETDYYDDDDEEEEEEEEEDSYFDAQDYEEDDEEEEGMEEELVTAASLGSGWNTEGLPAPAKKSGGASRARREHTMLSRPLPDFVDPDVLGDSLEELEARGRQKFGEKRKKRTEVDYYDDDEEDLMIVPEGEEVLREGEDLYDVEALQRALEREQRIKWGTGTEEDEAEERGLDIIERGEDGQELTEEEQMRRMKSREMAAVVKEAEQGGFRLRRPGAGGGEEEEWEDEGVEADEALGRGASGEVVRERKMRDALARAEKAQKDGEGRVETDQGGRKSKTKGGASQPQQRDMRVGEERDDDKFTVTYVETLSIDDIEPAEPYKGASFKDLGVDKDVVLENMEAMGVQDPTFVQAGALNATLGVLKEGGEAKDVIIHAHTGSGKTLAFLLPVIMQLDPESSNVQAVIIAPGRELASQTEDVCARLIDGTGLRSQKVFGGANVVRQIERLRRDKPQILVGTPGRIGELALEKRRIRLKSVKHLVLDEVDVLLQAPYDREIAAVVDACQGPRYRQTIFASATGKSARVKTGSEQYMKEDFEFVSGEVEKGGVLRAGAQVLPSSIKHCILTAPKVKKFESLRRVMNTRPFPECVMVFVNDPYQVNWLTEKLELVNIIAAPLSGDSSKEDRAEIMKRLASNRLGMLVTTEMAARGLDVPQLTHVVNYDLPTDADHYVHRAGRCGRAGRPGIVVNLATPDTKFVMSKFANKLGGIEFLEADVHRNKLWVIDRQLKEAGGKGGKKE